MSKVLATAGIASRRACEEIIFSGRVAVNGTIVTVPQTLVSLEEDRITVDRHLVKEVEKKIYLMLNKPVGYICTATKEGQKKIVLDLVDSFRERLFTVGRLDRDTSGLIIITNDGHFAQKVIHPSSDLIKEYLVKCDREIVLKDLLTISHGAHIEGSWIKPVRVLKVRNGTLKIAVKEGKKREVRYLVEKAQLGIVSLTRIRIGGLGLGTLSIGTWKHLSEREKEQIFR